MIPVNIMKMRRPERSGAISVLILYLLFTGYFNAISAHGSGFDMKCFLWPFLCWSPQRTTETVRAKETRAKPYRIIMFSPIGYAKKKICTCHYDLHRYGEEILHVHSDAELACESSQYSWAPRTWVALDPPPHKSEPIGALEGAVTLSFCDDLGGCGDGINFYVNDGQRSYEIKAGEGEYRLHCDGDV